MCFAFPTLPRFPCQLMLNVVIVFPPFESFFICLLQRPSTPKNDNRMLLWSMALVVLAHPFSLNNSHSTHTYQTLIHILQSINQSINQSKAQTSYSLPKFLCDDMTLSTDTDLITFLSPSSLFSLFVVSEKTFQHLICVLSTPSFPHTYTYTSTSHLYVLFYLHLPVLCRVELS